MTVAKKKKGGAVEEELDPSVMLLRLLVCLGFQYQRIIKKLIFPYLCELRSAPRYLPNSAHAAPLLPKGIIICLLSLGTRSKLHPIKSMSSKVPQLTS